MSAYRFVKVEGHDNWFMVFDGNTAEPQQIAHTMRERLTTKLIGGLHRKSDRYSQEAISVFNAANNIDYLHSFNKIGTLLIRPFGSYMPLKGNVIVDEKYSNYFPIDKFADIVICENDETTCYKWVKYLKDRFPDLSITTINFFYTRSNQELLEYFSKAKYVTFTTTFTSLEWFELLAENLHEENKVIGHCVDPDMWEKALEIHSNIEIVETEVVDKFKR